MNLNYDEVSFLFSECELSALCFLADAGGRLALPIDCADMEQVERGLTELEERGRLVSQQGRMFVDRVFLFLGYCIAHSGRGAVISGERSYSGVFVARRASICAHRRGGAWILTPFEQPGAAADFARDQLIPKQCGDTDLLKLYEEAGESGCVPLVGKSRAQAGALIRRWLLKGPPPEGADTLSEAAEPPLV